MTRPRYAVPAGLAVLAVLAVVLGPAPAQAACYGPTVQVTPGEAAARQTVTIVGQGFGDGCDEGAPADQVLGDPSTGIQVFLRQGSTEWLVAEGDADRSYSFAVDVTIPDETHPGTVEVITTPASRPTVEAWTTDDESGFPILVRATGVGPQPRPVPQPVVTFGPGQGSATHITVGVADPADEDTSPPGALLAALAVLGLLAVTLVIARPMLLRRQRERRSRHT